MNICLPVLKDMKYLASVDSDVLIYHLAERLHINHLEIQSRPNGACFKTSLAILDDNFGKSFVILE